jgi:23S rRNA (pseudouridine1915-N3)-methyltransferase
MSQVNLNRIELLVVGKAGSQLTPAIDDYERRLGRRVTLNVTVVKGEPLDRGEAKVLEAERDRILPVLDRVAGPDALIACCDSSGEQLDSREFAAKALVARRLVVIVGGAMGLHPDVSGRCGAAFGFGRVTLPHQLARLVVTEQLYRAFTIAHGEPYHH